MGYSVKLAGKALVETNNKDLASALDWYVLKINFSNFQTL
jgi:uncharacterized UBP type Zn finger protein